MIDAAEKQAVAIREATQADTVRVLPLARQFHFAARLKRFATFEDSTDGWINWLDRCIDGVDGLCCVAEDEGRIIGFCTAVVGAAFWNPAVRFVQETAVWVDEEHRGKGAGTGLVVAIEEWAERMGCDMVAAGASQGLKNPKDMRRVLTGRGYQLEERHYIKRLGA